MSELKALLPFLAYQDSNSDKKGSYFKIFINEESASGIKLTIDSLMEKMKWVELKK